MRWIFYLRITGESASAKAYDYAKHKITSPLYQERAIFAGGCFWCMVEPFETKPGVISVLSGYTGGETKNQITIKSVVDILGMLKLLRSYLIHVK